MVFKSPPGVAGTNAPTLSDPDLWTDEFHFLNQPGQAEIQSDLFYNYRANVDAYPKWQAWMREKQPRLFVIWGNYELSFDPSEPVDRGNIRPSNGIEICSLARISPTQEHPASEDLVPCEMMPRNRAELIDSATYNRPQRIFDPRI
jgi:hypothetical protein